MEAQQCSNALYHLRQLECWIDDEFTILAYPTRDDSGMTRLYNELKYEYGDISSFLEKYPFIPDIMSYTCYIYEIMSTSYKSHSSRKVLFPFNLKLFSKLYDSIPNNINKNNITLSMPSSDRKLYTAVFIYDDENKRMTQPYSNRKLNRSLTSDAFKTYITKEHTAYISNTSLFFKVLSLGTAEHFRELRTMIGLYPKVTTLKKTNTFLSKYKFEQFREIMELMNFTSSDSLDLVDYSPIVKFTSLCKTFRKSPVTYTFDGVQIKIYQTKSGRDIVVELYFVNSCKLPMRGDDGCAVLYNIFKIMGCWDALIQRVENEALICI